MDFESSIIKLYDPDSFDPSESGQAIEMSVKETKPYINAEISIDDGPPVPVTLFVDSGASPGLMVFPTTNEALEPPPQSVPGTVISGVGGDVEGVLARVSSLQLGSHRLTEIVGRFPDREQGLGNGVVGMGVLRRFMVTIDYPNERMLLRPAPNFADPFEYNMAGLILRPHPGGRVRVHNIMKNSPAIETGVRPGDIIVAIDGHELNDPNYAEAQSRLQEDGKTVELTIERAGEKIELTMTLRRLV